MHNGEGDGFALRLSASGQEMEYGTLIGGTGDESANGMALDDQGRVHLLVSTTSADFPVTRGAFDAVMGGESDYAVVRLDESGSDLEQASFLGGSGQDCCGGGIFVDGDDRVYVAGRTQSEDFPVSPGAFDEKGNERDGFLARIDGEEWTLAYATYLGGSDQDFGQGVVADGMGRAVVTGYTRSADFPTTEGAFDTSHNGGDDAFVVKVDTSQAEATATPTATASPTATPTQSPPATAIPRWTSTAEATPTQTATATSTSTPTSTPTATPLPVYSGYLPLVWGDG